MEGFPGGLLVSLKDSSLDSLPHSHCATHGGEVAHSRKETLLCPSEEANEYISSSTGTVLSGLCCCGISAAGGLIMTFHSASVRGEDSIGPSERSLDTM